MMIPSRTALILVLLSTASVYAQTGALLAPDLSAKVDKIVEQVLADPGAPPSASLAIVREGRVAYVHAYGNARLEPRTLARPEMRYSIGSISKQFTATAILWAAEQGKLN